MRKSSGLQFIGIMLVWIGVRFLVSARSGAEGASEPMALAAVVSAVAVGAAALFAALAVFRAAPSASRLVTAWAVLLFADLLLQESLYRPPLSWGLTTWLIVAGIGVLLAATVMHVRQSAATGLDVDRGT